MKKVMVLVGSVRKNSLGSHVGAWVKSDLETHKDIEVDYVEVAELDLPFFNEAVTPSAETPYESAKGNEWRERVGRADAFVILTAEYNHGPPASLKNALDWVYKEWGGKTAAFVGYSPTPSGAVRAVEQLQAVAIHLGLKPLQHQLILPGFAPYNQTGGIDADKAVEMLATHDDRLEMLISSL
jgi:NAD(P)H-dependent FMN reductase